MIRRRDLVGVLGFAALAAPWVSLAQKPAVRMHRIGFIGPGANQRTARALGLAIPQSVLVRADRVIE